MGQADLESYVSAWRKRFALAERERAALERRARDLLPILCRHLTEHYGARRIWLIGSLAEGGFHETSDIDLVVEGLPPGAELFRAGAELDDLARPFRVDLVPYEDAWEPVRRRAVASGEVLHDRG